MTNEYLRTSKGRKDEGNTARYRVEPLLKFMNQNRDKYFYCNKKKRLPL